MNNKQLVYHVNKCMEKIMENKEKERQCSDCNGQGKWLGFNQWHKCKTCDGEEKFGSWTWTEVEVVTADVPSMSQIIYPRHVLEKIFSDTKHLVESRKLFGKEFDFSDLLKISLNDASHIVTNLEIKNKTLFAKIETLPTEKGEELKNKLLTRNIKFGLCGIGTLNNQKIVQNDFKLTSINWFETR